MSRTTLCCAVALLILTTSPAAFAQIPRIATVTSQYAPTPGNPRAANLEVSSFSATANVPLKINPRTYLIPGLSYNLDELRFEGAPEGFGAFHAMNLSLLTIRKLPQDWLLAVRLAGGLAGDFEGVDDGMLRASILVLGIKWFSSNLSVGPGLIGSYSFGGLTPIPVLNVKYKPIPGIAITAFLPALAQIGWLAHERLEFVLLMNLNSGSYAVRNPDILNGPACQARLAASSCVDNVSYTSAKVGAEVNVKLWNDMLWLDFSGGRTIYRRLISKDADNERLDGGSLYLPNTWYLRSGLSLRPP